ncbi:MAG: hypothetical protein HC930_05100 [Hydrococcus sp. SU_1_0]|nr:hypothetical protein [Hydrococcus sp. SU_1_0]
MNIFTVDSQSELKERSRLRSKSWTQLAEGIALRRVFYLDSLLVSL